MTAVARQAALPGISAPVAAPDSDPNTASNAALNPGSNTASISPPIDPAIAPSISPSISPSVSPSISPSVAKRIAAIDWPAFTAELDAQGAAIASQLLTAAECQAIAALYDGDGFRSRVVMSRHGFGRGEYQYFAYPLPPIVAAMRASWYPHLVPIANRWGQALGTAEPFPEAHDAFLARCHAAGQLRPTPLLLRYGPGDYNCLHQDLYGAHVFPLQVALLLSEPGRDFTGGEFVMTEQRPRMQSRAMVLPLRQGDAVVFAVHHRPMQGTRGSYRVQLRHGVSRILTGQRHTLGVIFHDAT